MTAAELIKTARTRSGLTLRNLAERAGTSHSALAAYEAGRVVPRYDTLERVIESAGFALDGSLVRRRRDGFAGHRAKGRELLQVLDLAWAFPFRRKGDLSFPPFGRDR